MWLENGHDDRPAVGIGPFLNEYLFPGVVGPGFRSGLFAFLGSQSSPLIHIVS
jgi:hypothetical protein